jgi:hypothetical protein
MVPSGAEELPHGSGVVASQAPLLASDATSRLAKVAFGAEELPHSSAVVAPQAPLLGSAAMCGTPEGKLRK